MGATHTPASHYAPGARSCALDVQCCALPAESGDGECRAPGAEPAAVCGRWANEPDSVRHGTTECVHAKQKELALQSQVELLSKQELLPCNQLATAVLVWQRHTPDMHRSHHHLWLAQLTPPTNARTHTRTASAPATNCAAFRAAPAAAKQQPRLCEADAVSTWPGPSSSACSRPTWTSQATMQLHGTGDWGGM
jgi:hypothetical protein